MEFFRKVCNEVLEEHSYPDENEFWVERKIRPDAIRNILEERLEDYDDTATPNSRAKVPLSLRVNTLRRCQQCSTTSKSPPGHAIRHDHSRKNEAPIDASSLVRCLKKKRFGHAVLPDVDRRLIHVSDLSPSYVLALAQTAPTYQIPALRGALFKYLACKPSMSVQIPAKQWTVFLMDFHMPIWALRAWRPQEACFDGINATPRRAWEDLSFLATGKSHEPDEKTFGLQRAQISLAICGSSERHYTAYSFVDGHFDEDNEISDMEVNYETMMVDQIALDGSIDANHPIWNPREYYLTIILRRLRKAVREWDRVMGKIEADIKQFQEENPPLNTVTISGPDALRTATTIYYWTLKTRRIVSMLEQDLLKANHAWSRFSSLDGDRGYFDNIESLSKKPGQLMRQSIGEIQTLFGELNNFREELSYFRKPLKDQQRESFQNLKLLHTNENNRATQMNGFNSELMLSVVSPVAIVSTFFAIPQPFGSFKRNMTSFMVALLIFTLVLQLIIFIRVGQQRLLPLWGKVKATKMKLESYCGELGARIRLPRILPALSDLRNSRLRPAIPSEESV